MLDNLRNQTSFEPGEEPLDPIGPQSPKPRKTRRSFDQITGTKAPQRFMLSMMLLIMVCLLGVILLVFTGKVVLPLTF
jgi:hypothetical protein